MEITEDNILDHLDDEWLKEELKRAEECYEEDVEFGFKSRGVISVSSAAYILILRELVEHRKTGII